MWEKAFHIQIQARENTAKEKVTWLSTQPWLTYSEESHGEKKNDYERKRNWNMTDQIHKEADKKWKGSFHKKKKKKLTIFNFTIFNFMWLSFVERKMENILKNVLVVIFHAIAINRDWRSFQPSKNIQKHHIIIIKMVHDTHATSPLKLCVMNKPKVDTSCVTGSQRQLQIMNNSFFVNWFTDKICSKEQFTHTNHTNSHECIYRELGWMTTFVINISFIT